MVINLNKISLDKEIILNATKEVIHRFGPHKANITDVAKALKVSHADMNLRHWIKVMTEATCLSSINDPKMLANYMKLLSGLKSANA